MFNSLGQMVTGNPELMSQSPSVVPSQAGLDAADVMGGQTQQQMIAAQDAGFETYNVDDIVNSVKSDFNSMASNFDAEKMAQGLQANQAAMNKQTSQMPQAQVVKPQAQPMPMPAANFQNQSQAMQAIQGGIGAQPSRDQLIQMFMGGQR
jgi:hypothetical protein